MAHPLLAYVAANPALFGAESGTTGWYRDSLLFAEAVLAEAKVRVAARGGEWKGWTLEERPDKLRPGQVFWMVSAPASQARILAEAEKAVRASNPLFTNIRSISGNRGGMVYFAFSHPDVQSASSPEISEPKALTIDPRSPVATTLGVAGLGLVAAFGVGWVVRKALS